MSPAFDPDAVLALLSGVGLSRADIAAVVAADPLLLRSRVPRVGPRLLALRDRFGLSAQQIARFLLVGSGALRLCRDVGTKLEFWISFYGSLERLLVVMKRNNIILFVNLERLIKPNIALLGQCGLSAREIAKLCSNNARVIVYRQERLKEFFAVSTVACFHEDAIAAKLELLKRTLGLSKNEVTTAVSKQPTILGISEEYLLRKIQFLTNEVGVEPQQIVRRPALLTFSLEKRLVPRHHGIKVLQTKGLLNSNMCFCSLAFLTEKTFKMKFIESHTDSVPGLADAYARARAAKVTPRKSNFNILE
ncbi:hypothetical protein ACP70R_041574 [Stipagrostis hirtigluma subsp. patula]